jgi:transcriptional regulator with XRE-family HTH domain
MTPVALRLREWRERRGLSQTELADLAGTHQATVSGLETGQTQRIEFDLLQRLANALRCKPKDLIGEGK